MADSLILRADAIIRRPLSSSGPRIEIAYGEGSSREVLRFNNPKLVQWLLLLRNPLSLGQATETAAELLNCSPDTAVALIEELIDRRLLISAAELTLRSETRLEFLWQERGWRDALNLHRATRGLVWKHVPLKPSIMTIRLDDEQVLDAPPQALIPPNPQSQSRVKLSSSLEKEASFSDALHRRRTFRDFNETTVKLEQVEYTLYTAFGRLNRDNGVKAGPAPTYAVGNPFRVYLVAVHVENLRPGIYLYDFDEHALLGLWEGDASSDLEEIGFGMRGVPGCSGGLIYTVTWMNYMHKYRFSRAYRLVLLEVASLVQAQLLSATAAGLRTFLTPAIRDSLATQLLRIPDSLVESPLYLTTFG